MTEPLDYAAIQFFHRGHSRQRGGYCGLGQGDGVPCDAYRLAVDAERLAGKVPRPMVPTAAVRDTLAELEQDDCPRFYSTAAYPDWCEDCQQTLSFHSLAARREQVR